MRIQSIDKSQILISQLLNRDSEFPVTNNLILDDYGYERYLSSLVTPLQMPILNHLSPEYVDLLKDGYMKDLHFKIIYECFSNKKNPLPHSLATVIQRYKVIDGLLYHGYNELTIDKLYVPDNEIC